MASSVSQQGFRLLDLPAELRCIIYEYINIPPKKYTLTRTDADLIGHRLEWPAPIQPSTPESSITFLRPILCTDILLTCQLINSEATPTFARKLNALKAQPIQYLVDWASGCALGDYLSALSACLGSEACRYTWDGAFHPSDGISLAVRAFVSRCRAFSEATREDEDNGVQYMVVTLTHDNTTIGADLALALRTFGENQTATAMHMDIVYKSPLPDSIIGEKIIGGFRMERMLKAEFDSEHPESRPSAVSLRALGKSAFATHLENLTSGNAVEG